MAVGSEIILKQNMMLRIFRFAKKCKKIAVKETTKNTKILKIIKFIKKK